jgi:UDP-N-acetylmuramate dehydrogenase
VGAAPIQNIGAYGVELKDSLISLEAYELASAEKKIFSASDCELAYRESIFKRRLKNQFLISAVIFKLHKFPILNFTYGTLQNTLQTMSFAKLSIKVVSNAVIKIRQSKLPDPNILPNTGSFFKNPFIEKDFYENLLKDFPGMPHYPTASPTQVKIPAGWLIEQAGLKGKRFGKVGIYDKQALVLVNYESGQAHDIVALVETVQKTIFDKFQIQLQPEVLLV